MKIQPSMQTILSVLFGVSLAACGDDGGGTGDETGSTSSDPPTTSSPSTTMQPTTTSSPTTTVGTESSTGPEESGSGSEESSSSGGEEGFMFADDPYDAYTQIDRHAAVEAGTAGIAASQGLGFNPGSDISIRDEYNASNPAEDAALMWIEEISESVTFFHGALDDDITGFMLTPATVDEALAQAGPVIVPDTIKYDPSLPTGYPNGRALEDQVVDITLAAVLLDLGVHPLTAFADLPLNPPANDVPFEAEFPYLAPPH